MKTFLEKQYACYHKPAYLRLVPLICLRGFREKNDIELAGLIAAFFSYGRAEIIIRSISEIFTHTGRYIARFAEGTSLEQKKKLFKDFRYWVTADWKMAEEITSRLKRYDSSDPVRYDFSLCRSGMLETRKKAA